MRHGFFVVVGAAALTTVPACGDRDRDSVRTPAAGECSSYDTSGKASAAACQSANAAATAAVANYVPDCANDGTYAAEVSRCDAVMGACCDYDYEGHPWSEYASEVSEKFTECFWATYCQDLGTTNTLGCSIPAACSAR